MGRTSKIKGKKYEQEVARLYRSWGINAERAIQSRGPEGSDIILEDFPEFWVECHCSPKPNPFRKLKQALGDKAPDQHPILHIKKNKVPGEGGPYEFVAIPKELWFSMVKAWEFKGK